MHVVDKFGCYVPVMRLALVVPKLSHIPHAESLATALLKVSCHHCLDTPTSSSPLLQSSEALAGHSDLLQSSEALAGHSDLLQSSEAQVHRDEKHVVEGRPSGWSYVASFIVVCLACVDAILEYIVVIMQAAVVLLGYRLC